MLTPERKAELHHKLFGILIQADAAQAIYQFCITENLNLIDLKDIMTDFTQFVDYSLC